MFGHRVGRVFILALWMFTAVGAWAGLAAQFSRDYRGYGLGAKARYSSTGGFNLATANVITFSPPASQSFGSLDDLLPGSPFSLVPTGFGSNGTTVADTGTVMLTTYVGSLTNATTNRIATFTAAGQTASATVGYDGNGNIASDGVNAYLYDAEGNRIGNGSIAT